MFQEQKERAYIKAELSNIPPVECDFKVGDKVIFTNDYGIKFESEVIGFSHDNILGNGAFIHLTGGAYWFPHKQEELRHI